MRGLTRLRRIRSDVLDALNGDPPAPTPGEPEMRVLFVCYGNSCRSPLAEGVLRKKLADAGLFGRVSVDSAGTNAGDPGAPPHWRARRVARRHGLSIGDLRARRFVPEDLDRFDRIVVLDHRNREAVLAHALDDDARARVRLLRGDDGEVADPIGGGDDAYEQAYEAIAAGCDRLLEEIRSELSGAAPAGR